MNRATRICETIMKTVTFTDPRGSLNPEGKKKECWAEKVLKK